LLRNYFSPFPSSKTLSFMNFHGLFCPKEPIF
jgi:hypothetical protein